MGRLNNPGTSIADGRAVVTTAGTEVQLSTTPTRVRSLLVTAETDNTGNITVGGSTVVAALVPSRSRGQTGTQARRLRPACVAA